MWDQDGFAPSCHTPWLLKVGYVAQMPPLKIWGKIPLCWSAFPASLYKGPQDHTTHSSPGQSHHSQDFYRLDRNEYAPANSWYCIADNLNVSPPNILWWCWLFTQGRCLACRRPRASRFAGNIGKLLKEKYIVDIVYELISTSTVPWTIADFTFRNTKIRENLYIAPSDGAASDNSKSETE